jgi:colanic acid/amylovoran biosynthesis protein
VTTTRDLRILIINLHSSRNAGDAALLWAAVTQLRENFPGARLTLAINDVESVAPEPTSDLRVIPSFMALFGPTVADPSAGWRVGRLVWILFLALLAAGGHRLGRRSLRWLPKELRELVDAYAEADLVVSCPGNIFFTMGRIGLPFWVSAYTVGYALLMAKPLYVMPQSIGPLRRRWERWVVKALYSRARLVFVREPVSFRSCGDLGLPASRCRLVPDVAVNFPPASSEALIPYLDAISGADAPCIGATVINRIVHSVPDEGWDIYARSVAEGLGRFLDVHGGSLFFCPQVVGPTQGEDDRVMARNVMRQMEGASSEVRLLDLPTDPALLKAFYGRLDLFVATRMHSGIFALTMGTPTLFVGYLHKTQGLVEMLDMESWFLDIRTMTEVDLYAKLEALWQQRHEVRAHLAEMVPRLQERAAEVGELIACDFGDYGKT